MVLVGNKTDLHVDRYLPRVFVLPFGDTYSILYNVVDVYVKSGLSLRSVSRNVPVTAELDSGCYGHCSLPLYMYVLSVHVQIITGTYIHKLQLIKNLMATLKIYPSELMQVLKIHHIVPSCSDHLVSIFWLSVSTELSVQRQGSQWLAHGKQHSLSHQPGKIV